MDTTGTLHGPTAKINLGHRKELDNQKFSGTRTPRPSGCLLSIILINLVINWQSL